MTVHCPHCSTGYELPEHLLGPGGAKVRCPSCGQSFVVTRGGAVPPSREAAPPPAGEGAPETAGTKTGAETVAAELLAELEARLGSRLEKARRRGRVLAEIGPDLMACYDEYRSRAGPGASPEVFRRVLRERLDVSLDGRDG